MRLHGPMVGGLAGLLIGGVTAAQEPAGPPLVTDRPDQTESASIVPRATVQLELGGTLSETDQRTGRVRGLSVAQALVRIGLAPFLEARAGFAGWQRTSVEAAGPTLPAATGMGDLSVGVKLRAYDGAGLVPNVALIATLELPTGEEPFVAERVDPEVRLAVAHELSSRLSLGYNVAGSWRGVPDGLGGTTTETDLLYTAALGIGLADRLGAFVEGFGTVALDGGRASAHLLDGGFTVLVVPRVQADIAGGIGLNDAAEDWFVGVGLSVRFPR